jgi:hypothetical protein
MTKKVFFALFVVCLACKRHEGEGSLKPGDSFCGSLGDCFSCSQELECGWCGGPHCGETSEGCYNRSDHFANQSHVCTNPEDIFMVAADACIDPCVIETKCSGCLQLPVVPSLSGRGLRCGWAPGQCLLGTQKGPMRNISFEAWRWTNQTEAMSNPRLLDSFCARYGPCESNNRCLECANGFVSEKEGCVFCLDNRTAVGSVGEGGGSCVSEHKAKCTAKVEWTNFSESCPAMPAINDATSKPPGMNMRGAQRQLQVLVLGVFGLVVIGVLLVVNKLNG